MARHPTCSSMPREASAPQSSMERPHWGPMCEQLHYLPANMPHCLPYIVDETVSISPEEAQSATQACGKCTDVYFCPY
jgi:hypothetical protein